MGNAAVKKNRSKKASPDAADATAPAEADAKAESDGAESIGAATRHPVCVGCSAEADYQGVLYFDSGSTGTRPYVLVRRSRGGSATEFWSLSESEEVEQVRIHACVSSEAHGNEELLSLLKTASDESRVELLDGLRLSREFTDYIIDTIAQVGKIVNRWMQKEEDQGVKFWSNGSALQITDVVVVVTGGLRSVVGEAPAVVQEVSARLTGLLMSKLEQGGALNGARLQARLLPGSEEARCEAAAVGVLCAMQGVAPLGSAAAGVISMGGASVQVTASGTSLSVPLGRNLAIQAARQQAAGESGQLDAFDTEFAAARATALAKHPDLTEGPRTWIAVSGLYYTARDLGLRLEEPLDVQQARDDFSAGARAQDPKADASDMVASDSRVGSAACGAAVLAGLSGQIIFQREWLNPTTNQRLAATVSTGYVVSHYGFAGDLTAPVA